MKTLLIIVQEPQSSRGLVEYATDLARDLQTNLHFLYVENPLTYPLGNPGMSGAAVAQTQQLLEQKVKAGKQKLSELVTALTSSVSPELIVEVDGLSGNENLIIREQIDAGKAHMVLIEESESSGFWLRDTSVKAIVNDLDCPVWIMPKNAKYHSLGEIIYATDYQEEDISTIKKLITWTNPVTPHITALHITDNADFELKIKNTGFNKMLKARAGYSQIEVKALVDNQGDEMAELLNRYAARIGADLIVVLKENRHFFERIFSSGVSEKIIEESNRPVLVFHSS